MTSLDNPSFIATTQSRINDLINTGMSAELATSYLTQAIEQASKKKSYVFEQLITEDNYWPTIDIELITVLHQHNESIPTTPYNTAADNFFSFVKEEYGIEGVAIAKYNIEKDFDSIISTIETYFDSVNQTYFNENKLGFDPSVGFESIASTVFAEHFPDAIKYLNTTAQAPVINGPQSM